MDINDIQSGIAQLWQTLIRQIFLLFLTVAIVWRCFDLFSVFQQAAKTTPAVPANLVVSLSALAHDKDIAGLLTTFGIGTLLPLLAIFLLLSILQLHQTLVIQVGQWLPPTLYTTDPGLLPSDQLVELWHRSRARVGINLFLYELRGKLRIYARANPEDGGERGRFHLMYSACKFFLVFTLLLPWLAQWCGADPAWVAQHFHGARALQVVALCVVAGAYAAFRYFSAVRSYDAGVMYATVSAALLEDTTLDPAPESRELAGRELRDALEAGMSARWWHLRFDVLRIVGAARWSAIRAFTRLEDRRLQTQKRLQIGPDAYRDLYPIRARLADALRWLAFR